MHEDPNSRRSPAASLPPIARPVLSLWQRATLDVFDLVAPECAVGQRLSFHIEIAVALATPIVLLACLGAWAKLLVPFANREGGKRTLSDWPQVWDLVVWILLFQYPPLSCGAS